MSFTSLNFFFFLAIVLAVYHTAGRARLAGTFQWAWLGVTSLFFYGYENPQLLWLLGISILINCTAGWRIACHVSRNRPVPRSLMGISIGLNLLLLASFKYAGLLAGLIFPEGSPYLEMAKNVPLPIGISFYTFHGVSFLVDLSRAGGKESNLRPFCDELAGGAILRGLGKLALYINFFPQLISGPIMKAREFLPQISGRLPAQIAWRQALRYLILGYFLKMFVADNLQEQTSILPAIADGSPKKLDLLILLYGYSGQIFADFAGYSLIALGLAGLFGYKLPPNFNFPYLSSSITEFWRRWHMSLSTWLRDYLYFPLGGNRKGVGRTYLNLFLVMFLGGLWHGAAWRYAGWGAAHGLLLMIERYFNVTAIETSVRNASIKRWLGTLITFNLVSFLWLLFLMPDMPHVAKFATSLWQAPWGVNARTLFAITVYSVPLLLYYVWGYFRPNWEPRFRNSASSSFWEPAIYGAMLYLTITNAGAGGNFIYFNF